MKNILIPSLFVLGLSLAGPAVTQEENLQRALNNDTQSPAAERPWELTLGLGAGIMPEFKGSGESELRVLPLIMGSYQLNDRNKLFLGVVGGAGWKYQINEQLSGGLKLGYTGDRESVDSSRLTGMPDVDSSISAGPFIKYQLNRQFSVELDTAFDLTDAHGGWTVNPTLNYQNRFGPKWLAGASLGLTYGNDDYSQTYFGVDNAYTTNARAAYTAAAGITNYTVGLNLMRLLDANWFVRGDMIGTFYTSDAADSPVMEENTTLTSFMSVGYRF